MQCDKRRIQNTLYALMNKKALLTYKVNSQKKRATRTNIKQQIFKLKGKKERKTDC